MTYSPNTYTYSVWNHDEDCGDDYIKIVEPRLGPRGWYIANSYKMTQSPSISENEGEQSREYVNTVKETKPLSITENERKQSSLSPRKEPDSKSASVKDRTVSLFSRLYTPHGGGVPPPLHPIPDVVYGNTGFSHICQQHICPGGLRSPSRSFSGDRQIQHNVADVIGWPPLDITVNNVKCHVKDVIVNNGNTAHLLENNSLQLDEETYELENFKKNAMIIFNHEKFLVYNERRGTALDVAALEDTFKRFRFHVTTYNDLTEQELFDELERFSKNDFNDYGCICVAILTHGLDGGFLMAYDTEYRERDVFSCFNALTKPALRAKPIIFLIQACRGSAAAARVPHDRGQNVEYDAPGNSCRPTEADMIIFHSSFFGRASVRVVEEGTWFIQTVCEQMKLHGSTDHLEELFRRVRRIVALDKKFGGRKQMPTVTTTLLYKLYLKKIDDV